MARTLIVPGLRGSGPGHWQTWWQRRDEAAVRVEQEDWTTPDLVRWSDRIGAVIDAAREPVWLVAPASVAWLPSMRRQQGPAGWPAPCWWRRRHRTGSG